jgi:hypothetical protein
MESKSIDILVVLKIICIQNYKPIKDFIIKYKEIRQKHRQQREIYKYKYIKVDVFICGEFKK